MGLAPLNVFILKVIGIEIDIHWSVNLYPAPHCLVDGMNLLQWSEPLRVDNELGKSIHGGGADEDDNAAL
jgi:hypothetical protein